MKLALITTTINVPTVLALYRKLGPEVAIYVAGDRKTPDAVGEFCKSIGAWYSSYEEQYAQWPKLSEIIRPDCIQRRNFALLEALKDGADIIVSIDDDNTPMNFEYFPRFRTLLNSVIPFSGLKATGYGGWIDPGQFLLPRAKHRGFPFSQPGLFQVTSTVNSKIGVAAGVCLGDPDIDAVTRLANQHAPLDVTSVSELVRAGIVVDPRTDRTVFNSQNTAFIRELAPAMFMLPDVGRYDDIFASLVCQRVMRDCALHVHFGQPFVWQQRNAHNLIDDLKAEQFGMDRIDDFARRLDTTSMLEPGHSIIERTRACYNALGAMSWFPGRAHEAAQAWCEAVEQVL